MTKGEKFELVFKRVYYMGVFLLSYNSRSFKTFIGSSCKLKPDGGLILLLRYSACLFLVNIIARMLKFVSHHFFIMHFKFFILYIKCVYELQDIGGDLHDSTLQVCIASKANSSLCTSSGEFFYILQSNSSISVFTLHIFIPVENLTYVVINHQKGGDCKCI